MYNQSVEHLLEKRKVTTLRMESGSSSETSEKLKRNIHSKNSNSSSQIQEVLVVNIYSINLEGGTIKLYGSLNTLELYRSDAECQSYQGAKNLLAIKPQTQSTITLNANSRQRLHVTGNAVQCCIPFQTIYEYLHIKRVVHVTRRPTA